ncbi:MAG: MGMT family protein [Mesotoga sp.]|uniref:MGMT family protein n=1 Tax=unclassified Mesotoga TaxID=1184398 RepID=UPI000EF185B3|nr:MULTISPECIES: MGMT family protein [unclassified Mesotoga]MDI9367773.1 MGMT family protein [Thermotogota bacterium]NLT44058.1 cysteine methyltransferase [Thermotogaceae bacterium]MDD2333358.1 MGMT family protein [Mesotoga sp.]MDD3681196.1 MGMT family protein [Mesotoga sp.]MDD4207556.1 MGMT family protein [Mesotoga sp.]
MENERVSVYRRIYDMVRRIPSGRVATYGQIAALVGGCSARMVGYAMAGVSDETIPWQRVINARGRISIRDPNGYSLQKAILEREGIDFDESDSVDLSVFGWEGPI